MAKKGDWKDDWAVQREDPLEEEVEQRFLPTSQAVRASSGSDIHLAKVVTAANKQSQRCLAILPGVLSLHPPKRDPKNSENQDQQQKIEVGEMSGLLTDKPTLRLGNGMLQMTGQRIKTQSKFLVLTMQPKKKKVICRHIFDSVVVFGDVQQSQSLQLPKQASSEESEEKPAPFVHHGSSARIDSGGKPCEYLSASIVAKKRSDKEEQSLETSPVDESEEENAELLSGSEDEYGVSTSGLGRRPSSQRKQNKTRQYKEDSSVEVEEDEEESNSQNSDFPVDDEKEKTFQRAKRRPTSTRNQKSRTYKEDSSSELDDEGDNSSASQQSKESGCTEEKTTNSSRRPVSQRQRKNPKYKEESSSEVENDESDDSLASKTSEPLVRKGKGRAKEETTEAKVKPSTRKRKAVSVTQSQDSDDDSSLFVSPLRPCLSTESCSSTTSKSNFNEAKAKELQQGKDETGEELRKHRQAREAGDSRLAKSKGREPQSSETLAKLSSEGEGEEDSDSLPLLKASVQLSPRKRRTFSRSERIAMESAKESTADEAERSAQGCRPSVITSASDPTYPHAALELGKVTRRSIGSKRTAGRSNDSDEDDQAKAPVTLGTRTRSMRSASLSKDNQTPSSKRGRTAPESALVADSAVCVSTVLSSRAQRSLGRLQRSQKTARKATKTDKSPGESMLGESDLSVEETKRTSPDTRDQLTTDTSEAEGPECSTKGKKKTPCQKRRGRLSSSNRSKRSLRSYQRGSDDSSDFSGYNSDDSVQVVREPSGLSQSTRRKRFSVSNAGASNKKSCRGKTLRSRESVDPTEESDSDSNASVERTRNAATRLKEKQTRTAMVRKNKEIELELSEESSEDESKRNDMEKRRGSSGRRKGILSASQREAEEDTTPCYSDGSVSLQADVTQQVSQSPMCASPTVYGRRRRRRLTPSPTKSAKTKSHRVIDLSKDFTF